MKSMRVNDESEYDISHEKCTILLKWWLTEITVVRRKKYCSLNHTIFLKRVSRKEFSHLSLQTVVKSITKPTSLLIMRLTNRVRCRASYCQLCPSICQCYSLFNILCMLFLRSVFYWAVCIVWWLFCLVFILWTHVLFLLCAKELHFISYVVLKYVLLWHLYNIWSRTYNSKKYVHGLLKGNI